MRFGRQAVAIEEATRRLMQHVRVLPPETVELDQADGRVLAADLEASGSLPPFDRSAMDGYAVRAKDTLGASPKKPLALRVVGAVMAGEVPSFRLLKGEAARIMTGAMIPEGADAVILFEQTGNPGADTEAVAVKKQLAAGENIIRQGEEAAAHEIVLKAGEIVNAGAKAVLSTFGYTRIPVTRQPRIGIMPTGDELVAPQQELTPGKIRDCNTAMLAQLVRESGGIPVVFPPVSDDDHNAAASIEERIRQVDLLVTTGGVSVGDLDVIASFVDRTDVALLFNRVAMRPGSPTTAARIADKLLCALSGNPGACFTGFQLFVKPLIRQMLGELHPEVQELEGVLVGDVKRPCPYPRYLRGKMVLKQAVLHVIPDRLEKLAPLRSLKESNCLIVIPPGGAGASEGELVKVVQIAPFPL
ncbi:molybdopterin molybdenumtransferase MoeA [Brevibacillus nitrificans]|uniref:Molybdopterin molybdenumtransferase n=1 Tax=Brevibacillus nitrificans TaxID=651560 RepID=A0A3M8DFJ9_9BACL|nr:gephyrin-like molybdotransferase Glp [Brevibacillus nitrificans]RNB86758.1 molybdopterin molybdenumtransferase MoeA [Brevibacillus nitrificans]